jgi:hypothetical protein
LDLLDDEHIAHYYGAIRSGQEPSELTIRGQLVDAMNAVGFSDPSSQCRLARNTAKMNCDLLSRQHHRQAEVHDSFHEARDPYSTNDVLGRRLI